MWLSRYSFFCFFCFFYFLFSLIRKICPMFLGGRLGICRPCSGCQGLHTKQGGRLGPGNRGGVGCESVASRNQVTARSGHHSCGRQTHAALSWVDIVLYNPGKDSTCVLVHQQFICPLPPLALHSSTLAWKIPWTEEPGGLRSMGSLRVRHDWVTSLSLFSFMHWRGKGQPTPVFLPGESQGRGRLVGCRLWGRTELDTTEVT